MEKAKKDVGQTFRRMKHNLRNPTKKERDEDYDIRELEQRNAKIVSLIRSYRKNVANTIKTGLKEEHFDKRRKKLDEYGLCIELRDSVPELEKVHSTCLYKVADKMSQTLQDIVEERVKLEMMVEKRVLDGLSPYQEMDKNLAKSREKLSNAATDVEIARIALEKSDGSNPSLQDAFDASQQKFENQKDNNITDIYSFVSREQEIAKIFAALLEEQLEFHRSSQRSIETALNFIKQDINNARPRPVFGVDLSEHLRHTQERIAVVLEKCCTLLRDSGFNEKGLFRVSGNNTKIRRMKAAFDAGQIENDGNGRTYQHDPHSVCSVLKSYLRELPDPLLTNRLHNDWVNAIRLDGEERLRAIEQCILHLPEAHRDNLTYLIQFLVELLDHQNVTAMNVSNLAIVFGPNLLGGEIDTNNAVGTRVVEVLLKNASRLFGCMGNNGYLNQEMITSTSSLNIDTSLGRFDSNSPSRISWSPSPRVRPKEKAPPPPVGRPATGQLIDTSDWTSHQTASTTRQYADGAASQFDSRHIAYPDSDNSFDDFDDEEISPAELPEKTPIRPPPPSYEALDRTASTKSTVSNQQPHPKARFSHTVLPEHGQRSTTSTATSIKRPVVVKDDSIGVSDESNRTFVSVEAPTPIRTKPPLPAKPKPDNEFARL